MATKIAQLLTTLQIFKYSDEAARPYCFKQLIILAKFVKHESQALYNVISTHLHRQSPRGKCDWEIAGFTREVTKVPQWLLGCGSSTLESGHVSNEYGSLVGGQVLGHIIWFSGPPAECHPLLGFTRWQILYPGRSKG